MRSTAPCFTRHTSSPCPIPIPPGFPLRPGSPVVPQTRYNLALSCELFRMHILHVVGARPNFMKAAPVLRALATHAGVQQTLVHTGQHYDAAMSDVFFQQLGMPQPD